MHMIRVSMLFCYTYFVFGKSYYSLFVRPYVIDGYQCISSEISFDNLNINNDAVSCVMHCVHQGDCLSISYDNITKRCVGCNNFIHTNATDAGDSSLLVFEKQAGLVMITTTTPPILLCPPDDTMFRTVTLSDGEHFTYKVVKTYATQVGAIAGCSAEGGFLSRVKTVAKMNMLLGLVRNCPGYSGTQYYVDGSNANASDYNAPGAWKFLDGDPVPMTRDFWGPTYPNNATFQHCLRMQNFTANYKFDDSNCNWEFYYICEK